MPGTSSAKTRFALLPGMTGEGMAITSPHQIPKLRMLLQIIHHETAAGDHL